MKINNPAVHDILILTHTFRTRDALVTEVRFWVRITYAREIY